MKTYLPILMMCLLGGGVDGEDAKPAPPTVKLFTTGDGYDNGIQVLLLENSFPGVKTDKVDFHIRIVNWLLDEVFVEVTNLGDAVISIDGFGPWGSSCTVFPDNVPLLKRLHGATISSDGKRSACGCAIVDVTQSRKIDLSEYIGRTGKLTFYVRGFYRTNGAAFTGSIDLKFQITEPHKSEQGADGKTPEASQPSH